MVTEAWSRGAGTSDCKLVVLTHA